MRLLITHNPTNVTLNTFIEELKTYGFATIGRVCGASYDTAPVEKEGIHGLHWSFDGAPKSNLTVDDWLNAVKIKFHKEPLLHIKKKKFMKVQDENFYNMKQKKNQVFKAKPKRKVTVLKAISQVLKHPENWKSSAMTF
jgi:hypothetical protein